MFLVAISDQKLVLFQPCQLILILLYLPEHIVMNIYCLDLFGLIQKKSVLLIMAVIFVNYGSLVFIVSAKPGHEFISEGSPAHVGGASHGGLHQQDSLVSMIVTGTDSVPSYLRLIDIKEWVLSLIS